MLVVLHIVRRVRKARFNNKVWKKVETTYSEFHKSLVISLQPRILDDQDLKIKQRNGIVFREGEGPGPPFRHSHRIQPCTMVDFLAPRAAEIAEAPANWQAYQCSRKKLGNHVGIKGVLGEVERDDGRCADFILYPLGILFGQPTQLALEKRVESAKPPMGLATFWDPPEFDGEVVEYFEKVDA